MTQNVLERDKRPTAIELGEKNTIVDLKIWVHLGHLARNRILTKISL